MWPAAAAAASTNQQITAVRQFRTALVECSIAAIYGFNINSTSPDWPWPYEHRDVQALRHGSGYVAHFAAMTYSERGLIDEFRLWAS